MPASAGQAARKRASYSVPAAPEQREQRAVLCEQLEAGTGAVGVGREGAGAAMGTGGPFTSSQAISP